jgi:hypothetical protein
MIRGVIILVWWVVGGAGKTEGARRATGVSPAWTGTHDIDRHRMGNVVFPFFPDVDRVVDVHRRLLLLLGHPS